jgi:osomolarity two-component system sensor histidine kinase NIK1
MHPKDAPSATSEQVLREILDSVKAMKDGHFTTHVCDGLPGLGGEIAKVLNEHLRMLQSLRAEHRRLTEEIGVTGRLGGQMEVAGTSGAWKEIVDEMNRMGGHVTAQYRDGWNIVRALLRGELSARMTCQCIQGEFREFKENLNELADRFEQQSAVEQPV